MCERSGLGLRQCDSAGCLVRWRADLARGDPPGARADTRQRCLAAPRVPRTRRARQRLQVRAARCRRSGPARAAARACHELLSANALRVAATRGRLKAAKAADGTWRSCERGRRVRRLALSALEGKRATGVEPATFSLAREVAASCPVFAPVKSRARRDARAAPCRWLTARAGARPARAATHVCGTRRSRVLLGDHGPTTTARRCAGATSALSTSCVPNSRTRGRCASSICAARSPLSPPAVSTWSARRPCSGTPARRRRRAVRMRVRPGRTSPSSAPSVLTRHPALGRRQAWPPRMTDTFPASELRARPTTPRYGRGDESAIS